MGRRKLGQPRVHRIVVMDQFSNEIESHELDEFGRLKEKISNTKRRAINLLVNNNNNNNNMQIQPGQMLPPHDHPAMKFPQQPFINLPNMNLPKITPSEINTPLKNNPIHNFNENQFKTENYNLTPTRLLINSPLNINKEKSDKSIKQAHNPLNESLNPQNVNPYKNIPQPQISPKASDNILHNISQRPIQILNQLPHDENANQCSDINNQPISNSIPIPIVKPPNFRNQFNQALSSHIAGNRALPSSQTILNNNRSDYSYHKKNTISNTFTNYFTYQKIFDLPEGPTIPLFLIDRE